MTNNINILAKYAMVFVGFVRIIWKCPIGTVK